MNFFRTIIFYIAFSLITLVVGGLGLPFVFINRKFAFVTSKTWAKFSIIAARLICGLKYEVIRDYKLPENYIVASKHQSTFETLLFWTLVKNPAYVIKKELLSIPVFGHYLKYTGMIAIDRKAGIESIKKIVQKGEDYQADRNLIIFPEGTRTKYGKETQKYSSGIFAIYKNLNKPVVPIALNTGKYWPNHKLTIKPGVITVKYLPIIQPGLDKESFMSNLKDIIEKNSISL